MASYHFSANVIGRSQGRSSTAAAAYRAGEAVYDDRTGLTHDYSRKQGVEESFIVAPEDAPEWMRDREALWNAVEAIEKRKDAQLARDVTLGLPHELSADERKTMLVAFVEQQFVNRGMVADVALHAPDREGDNRNHHAHVMLTLRELTEDGFGKKNRDWNSKELLETWRERWAHFQNQALERKGEIARVDHRSYADQGKDLVPTQHEGAIVTEMKRRGRHSDIAAENDRIMAENREREKAASNLEILSMATSGREGDGVIRNPDELKAFLQNQQLDERGTLGNRHKAAERQLETRIQDTYGDQLAELRSKAEALQGKIGQEGVKGVLRQISGLNAIDGYRLGNVEKSIGNIEQRIEEMQGALKHEQELDRYHLKVKEQQQWTNLSGYIDQQTAETTKSRDLEEQYYSMSEYSRSAEQEASQEQDLGQERTLDIEPPKMG